jgi:Ni/Co efflux regulator RcnB
MKDLSRSAARIAVVGATALALLLPAALPAAADPKHCPPGHAKKGWCGNGGNGAASYEQGYRDGRRDERRYSVGDRVERNVYTVIEDYRRYDLPDPRRGYHYVRIDGDIVLVAVATGIIAELLFNR